MNKAALVLIWIALFIFITPVCVMAGAFGGCLFGAVLSPVSDSASTLALGLGSLLGFAAGVAIPILVVRSINNNHRRMEHDRPQF